MVSVDYSTKWEEAEFTEKIKKKKKKKKKNNIKGCNNAFN